jgi:imidazolonepropionase-like amidohydrolase
LLTWKISYVTKEQIKEHIKWPEIKYIQARFMYLPTRVSKERQMLTMQNVIYLTKRLHNAGANLAIGTGSTYACVVPGFSIRRELKLLVEAGLTPYEALRMATYNGAKLLKKEDQIGTIAEGKSADLILLTANPLENIENIKKQAGVMIRGKWYPQSELNKALKFVEAINSRKY